MSHGEKIHFWDVGYLQDDNDDDVEEDTADVGDEVKAEEPIFSSVASAAG